MTENGMSRTLFNFGIKELTMKYIFAIISLLSSSLSFGGIDYGKIKYLAINVQGIMSIQLDNGFPASSASLCPNSNGWAYVPANAPQEFKSVLMAANAARSNLQISINECLNGNSLQLDTVTILQE